MDDAIWSMLNDAEKQLLRQAAPDKLADLDEDALSELHSRIRRARNKYSKLYRRRASSEVSSSGSRSKGHSRHARTLVKAEAFEEALADVSAKLAKAARASADALRKERIAQARGESNAGGEATSKSTKTASGKKKSAGGPSAKKPKSSPKSKSKTPQSKRATGQARASKARKQAARDAR